MTTLRARTRGLRFPSLADLPGLACDRTLVKLALLRQLVAGDPNHPSWYTGPLALARAVAASGYDLHLPVGGHQDTGALPDHVDAWLAKEREPDGHLEERVRGYLTQLHEQGALDRLLPPRLSLAGGDIVLTLARAEEEAPL
jgi:hypothetical protein